LPSTDCSSVCTIVQSKPGGAFDELSCDATIQCSGVGETVHGGAAHDYAATGTHDIEVWGTCSSNAAFCCALDDTAGGTVTKVVYLGTPNADVINFSTGAGDDLGPHRAYHLDGFIFGGDGDDIIDGSDYVGNQYRDNLYGENGNDIITGGPDGDWIDGGPGDDTLSGEAGDDRMVGGDGNDTLSGGDGNDALCDSSGNAAGGCVIDLGTSLFGDLGADVVYYEVDAAAGCTTERPNFASSCGGGVDEWGNFPAWATPGTCEGTRGTWPTACNDPN
jgi:Ca2+-binding RTX toxin-like protein